MKKSIGLMAGSAMLMIPIAVSAQVATGDSRAENSGQDAGRSVARNDEIVVTAQKRTENVQDVPKSVAVVSQAQLVQAGVTSIQDLSRVSPSIQGVGAGPFAPPAIRGISSFALSIGVLTKTGIVLDDIPQPTFSTLANELSDVERVEILSGPQSTLSGRNAAGGLINIVTRSPSREWAGNILLEQTDDEQSRISGYVSGPIAETLAFSVSAFYNDWVGPYRNVVRDDEHLGGFRQRGVRGKLRWTPTEALTITASGFYTKGDFKQVPFLAGGPYVLAAPGAGFVFIPGSTIAGLHPGAAIEPHSREVSLERFSRAKNENKGGSLRFDYDTDLGTVSSISSYSRGKQPRLDVLGGFPIGAGFATQDTNTDVKYLTQEFRLASASTSKLQYLLGAFYSDTDNFQPFARDNLFPVDWDRSTRTKSIAVYGRATYEILEGTSLTGGLRYQHDDQSYDFVFNDGSGTNSSRGFKYDFITGEASLQHEFAPDIKGYLTYANAQTGKAYDLEDNVGASSPAGLLPLDSEKVQNYEIGFKTQWLDRRLTVNISAFWADYKDYQVQSLEPLTDPNQIPRIRLLSVGRVRNKGIELGTSYTVSDNLRFSFDATYLDAKIRDYPGAQCFAGQTVEQGCVGGLQNRRGPLPGTSKLRVASSVTGTVPLPSLPFDGTLGAFFRYQSKASYDVLGDPLARQGGFGVLNLTAGIRGRDSNYSFEVFANNVTDKHYYSTIQRDAFATGDAAIGSLARDSYRYFGARFNYRF